MDGGGLVLVLDRTIDEGAEPVLIACPAPDEGTVAAKLYAMRTTIAAVDDVARGVAGSTTAAVHLRLDGLLLTAATVTPSQRAGFSICVIREGDPTALAQSIAQAVRFRFGELDVQGVQRRTGDVKAFLGAYMAKVMHPCRSGCVLVADHVATFKPGLSASVQISELLTAVETSPRAMVDTAITGRPRYCTPLGACLFRRGLCIGSHLPLPDVVDTARFCAIQGIVDRSEHDGLVVSWHRVHPSGERSRILCMVASADIVACMQFVCHSEGTPDGHIDPFYTSELQNLAIGFARGDHRDLLVQVDRDLQRYAGLVVSLDDLPAELHSRADQGRVVVVAPPSPQSRSAPSSPRIRRRARASSLSPRRLPSAVPDAGPQVDGPPRRITIGDPNVLLHYVIIDRASSTRFDSDPPRDGASDLDRQVVACFHRAVARMERQLDRSVRDKRRQDVDRTAFPGLPAPVLVAKAKCELNGDENRKRFGSRRVPCPGTVEQRLKFDLTAGSPSVAFADRRVQFWVIGRLVPPATECYVCVEGSVPQNTVDLAFQLVAAWS
ncbi:CCZ1/INTU/HSP4 first Longin domain-containing protein [Plasmodiophora brassicae]|nr:hypothetical protein PBRA_008717 [Plasmodiophora brassicae]